MSKSSNNLNFFIIRKKISVFAYIGEKKTSKVSVLKIMVRLNPRAFPSSQHKRYDHLELPVLSKASFGNAVCLPTLQKENQIFLYLNIMEMRIMLPRWSVFLSYSSLGFTNQYLSEALSK